MNKNIDIYLAILWVMPLLNQYSDISVKYYKLVKLKIRDFALSRYYFKKPLIKIMQLL